MNEHLLNGLTEVYYDLTYRSWNDWRVELNFKYGKKALKYVTIATAKDFNLKSMEDSICKIIGLYKDAKAFGFGFKYDYMPRD